MSDKSNNRNKAVKTNVDTCKSAIQRTLDQLIIFTKIFFWLSVQPAGSSTFTSFCWLYVEKLK